MADTGGIKAAATPSNDFNKATDKALVDFAKDFIQQIADAKVDANVLRKKFANEGKELFKSIFSDVGMSGFKDNEPLVDKVIEGIKNRLAVAGQDNSDGGATLTFKESAYLIAGIANDTELGSLGPDKSRTALVGKMLSENGVEDSSGFVAKNISALLTAAEVALTMNAAQQAPAAAPASDPKRTF